MKRCQQCGSWSGTTVLPGFSTTLHYTQTFSINEATAIGILNTLSNCSASESVCFGVSNVLQGELKNTAVNPSSIEEDKQSITFARVDGWNGQWTLQINKVIFNADGSTSIQYNPIPMNEYNAARSAGSDCCMVIWLRVN